MIYADTSFVISLVLADFNSEKATELAAEASHPIFLTDLLRLELQNGICLAVRLKGLDEKSATAASIHAATLERNGVLNEAVLDWPKVFARARGLSIAWTSRLQLRSLYIVHVASAMELGARDFWSFDKRQRELAHEVGLRINP